MFVLPCAIIAILSLYLSFLCFGLLVQTQSRPCGLCHSLYTLAHINGFRSPHLHFYACLLLCFMLMLASLVLGFATLDALNWFMVVWLRPMPMRPCLDVTIWGASPWCRLLRAMICFSCLFMPPVWQSMHLYMLAYMFMHESCLLVCHPCFNTMKLWTFDPNLHFSITDTTFCLLSCLFSFSFVCWLSCLSACFLVSLLAMSIMLICFMSPLYAFCIFSFHRLFAGFLFIAFACTHLERGCTELGHDLPGAREKGMGASMSFEPSDGNQ